MMRITSNSSRVTMQIGATLIRTAMKERRGPYLFLLRGDLGSGKTTFVRGALSYFGIQPRAASPTFVIMKRYVPKKNKTKVKNVFHIDAYRLHTRKDMNMLGLPLSDTHAMFFIEWPEQVKLRPTRGTFVIHFQHGSNTQQRSIQISRK